MKKDDWFSISKVVEIGQDYVVVEDILSGEQTIFSKSDICKVDDNCLSIRIPEDGDEYDELRERLASGLGYKDSEGGEGDQGEPGEAGSGKEESSGDSFGSNDGTQQFGPVNNEPGV